MKFYNKKTQAIIFCSSFILLQLTACGGGSGFATGPRGTDDTSEETNTTDDNISSNISDDTNAPNPNAQTPAAPEIGFSPETGTELQPDDNTITITGLAAYTAVCITEGEAYPTFEGPTCIDGLQLDAPPNDLVLALNCETNDVGIQSRALKVTAINEQSEQAFASADYTQVCGQPETEEPNRDTCRINDRTVTNSVSWNYQTPITFSAGFGRLLTSASGSFELNYQNDGNLVLRNAETRESVWSSQTNNRGENGELRLQDDGDLTIYSDVGLGLWNSATSGAQPDYLMVTDIGAVIMVQGNDIIWSEGNSLETCDNLPEPENPDTGPGEPIVIEPDPEPNRQLAAIAIGRPNFTTREEITVSYSIAFEGQFLPSGETLGLFPAGSIAPDCTFNGSSVMDLPLLTSSGDIAFPPQLALGAYQVQVRDQKGCHLGEPKSLNVVEPEVLVASLVNGLNGYNGAQDTTLVELGLYMNIPLGDDKDLWVYKLDGENGELIMLVQWDVPAELAGGLIKEVALQFDVKNDSNDDFTIYAMNAPWDEDTAIWNNANLAVNQGNTPLGVFSPRQKGLSLAQLNDAGVALVQSWMDGVAPNYGFVIRAPIGNTDGVDVKSSDEKDVEKKPTMQIYYVE